MTQTPSEDEWRNSVLLSVKHMLNIPPADTAYDLDIITHVNSAFTTLNDLGIGPDEGFMIEDSSSTWAEFLGPNVNYNSVKTYMFLCLRLVFDPPATSFHLTALNEQIREHEYRLSVRRDSAVLSALAGETALVDGHPLDPIY
jgi:hypothetical protein